MDGEKRMEAGSSMKLRDQVLTQKLWPTPRSADGERNYKASPGSARKGGNLTEELWRMLWPTPTSRDYKDGSNVENVPVNCLLGRAVNPTPETGSLNAEFVEALMGLPIGWTQLKEPFSRRKK